MILMVQPMPDRPRERIVDQVFAAKDPSSHRRLAIATIAACVAYGALAFWLWQAPPAAHALLPGHKAVTRTHDVELEPPRPPPPPPEKTPPARSRTVAHAAPAPAAAQAGKVIARESTTPPPAGEEPPTFAEGNGERYAGGSTLSSGTSKQAVTAPVVQPGPAPRGTTGTASGPDRSAAVALAEEDWSCPWPAEADAAEIDEQAVVLRVVVRADGTVQSAALVSDPGFGFGAAALACARRTRFTPARDAQGKPVAARSPPIRVRFTR